MPHLAMAYLMTGDKQYLDAAQAVGVGLLRLPHLGLRPLRRHGSGDGASASSAWRSSTTGAIATSTKPAGSASGRLSSSVPRPCSRRRPPAIPTGTAPTCRIISGSTSAAWAPPASLFSTRTSRLACGSVWPWTSSGARWRRSAPTAPAMKGSAIGSTGPSTCSSSCTLADELLSVDLYDRPWWRNTARYCQYLSLPVNAWTRSNCIVDLADCPRGHWYGPDHILRHLAGRYRDGHAQWLAEQIDKANVDAPGARWLNLIWYDPAVQAVPPSGLPTLHHFEDMGIVSARTGWDGRENLVVFKCGPFIGHKALSEFSYDPGGGHVHPDVGPFRRLRQRPMAHPGRRLPGQVDGPAQYAADRWRGAAWRGPHVVRWGPMPGGKGSAADHPGKLQRRSSTTSRAM